MGLIYALARQFAHPTGWGGRLAVKVMNVMNRTMYKDCVDAVQAVVPRKVLEVGFGNGKALQLLGKNNREMQLYGIELSLDALRMAKQKLGARANLAQGDVAALKFEPQSFDAIYTINTFYFWPNPAQCLSEVYRTLAPEGVFVQVCYTKKWLDRSRVTAFEYNKIEESELLELHRLAGFRKVEKKEIQPGKSFCLICTK